MDGELFAYTLPTYQTQGFTPDPIKVTAKTNDEYDDRNATVSIISNDKTFSVTVKQAKKTGIYLTEREKTHDFDSLNLQFLVIC